MREENCRLWRNTLDFSGCFIVDCRGKSGGLALLWREPANVSIKSFSMGHIDCIIQESGNTWRFTGFYGNPDASLRHFSWDLLRRLKGLSDLCNLPWLVGGDFNEICFDSEKMGGTRRAPSQMQAFRDTLESCELQDLHCSGELFSWVNRRGADSVVFERLDRFVGNLNWRLLYPAARISSLEFYHSDHRPIFLELHRDHSRTSKQDRNHKSLFRFEKCWLMENDCKDIVEMGWDSQEQQIPLMDRIMKCKSALQNWAMHRFRSFPKKIKMKRDLLNNFRTSLNWNTSTTQIHELEAEIEKLETQNEIYWRQRSRVSWLKDGDRNSRYFHTKASRRKTQNCIDGLVSSHGDWCTKNSEMAEIVLDYFGSLFKSTSPTYATMAPVLNALETKVDDQMNQFLCAPFTEDEVRRALFDMNPDKAPGPDGMSTLFYQKFWHVVGREVTAAVLQVLNDGASLEAWNATLVTLIPKTKNPMLMKEFRPISLCNVCYKIVSRAITNRFRPILSKIISDSQSAFIPGRLITDNVIVGFETLHWMRNRRVGRSGFGALKLDMSKAYDRVEWEFLQALLARLGFANSWIGKIMHCVKTVTYSFLVNGEVIGPINPSRGLRQGDPLSPYLFVLCAQGLSALISAYESRGLFRGVKIASTSPSISHLFFADDSLVFFRATMEEGARVKECLTLYERASGQLINYDKSALSFSPNTNQMLIDTIKSILTIPVVHQHDLYLGLPTVSMKSKRLQFKYLVERVVRRIQGWGHKFFSTGGKEVLIKSIIQAIPTYAMSCFKIPISICEDIEKECANFWWGVENGQRKMHWRTWDFLCQPKVRGGLGFRKMEEFNRAMLAKQLWRLLRNPDSLVCRVLKARYFKHENIMEARLGSNPSYFWRSLLWSKEILAKGLLWRVGDGKTINIFEENWIPSLASKVGNPLVPWTRDTKVSTLIKDGTWDVDLISNSFDDCVAGEILKIPLPTNPMGDSQFWRFDTKGKYSVRDGYRLQRGLFTPPEHQSEYTLQHWWSFLWSLSLPPKVRIFWWNASHDLIPTNHNLLRHHVPVNGDCLLCHFACDTTCHSLFFCPAIKHLWKNTIFYHTMKVAKGAGTLEFNCWMQKQLSKREFENFAIQTWAIWKEKQNLLHGNGWKTMAENISWSTALLNDFQKARQLERLMDMSSRSHAEKKWKPPRRSALKLNVDACVNSSLNRFSVGGVLRDKQGRLLLAFGKQINQPISVVHGELLAIREGVLLLHEKNFHDVQIATDSLLAVQAVTATQEDLGYVGVCASELNNQMHEPVISDFIHVYRSANLVAHNIAHFASSSPSSFVWRNGEFPSWLVKLVTDDVV